jgi:hypothetical protein
VAIVRDVMRTAAASHRVRVRPDSAAGSVVLVVRAAAVVRTDSARAIDPGRAVAAVVPVRARARDVDLARAAAGNADASSPVG